ncbi:dipeptidase [Aliiglaciecola sp. LCG003]|uniref:dipeptidase n=1 Tax=Aliiglaciecola sp. LCG003 TaxID=3053655 RepID=UPI00257272AC|nr:dipeptidase [Aliiglaciecola sp. LCG003]WJG09762.1 dipeptidase [Aliiglaciecola sp. LCG003]
MNLTKVSVYLLALLCIGYVLVRLIAPPMLEKGMNKVEPLEAMPVNQAAKKLHQRLIVGDWHADSTLWSRNLASHETYGHVDLPRLQQGNVAMQMFTTVTKSPDGLNYDENQTDAADNITKAAIVQGWPFATLTSLTARALFQAEKIHTIANEHPDDFVLVTSKDSLAEFMLKRQSNPKLVAGLLGTEGSHALDGKLANIEVLYNKGFRMMSLQHFFDNKLGGSLHGTSQAGLTDFGRDALKKMQQMGIIVDLSHSSAQTVKDVLTVSTAPLVISHTGFKGDCDTKRNIDDALMRQVAQTGGLIAVGYWDGAVCGISPNDVADSIIYGIDLVGEDHVALGSDFDGAVTTAFDSSQLVFITQALLDKNVDESVIAKVMGGNMLAFLQKNLPDE